MPEGPKVDPSKPRYNAYIHPILPPRTNHKINSKEIFETSATVKKSSTKKKKRVKKKK